MNVSAWNLLVVAVSALACIAAGCSAGEAAMDTPDPATTAHPPATTQATTSPTTIPSPVAPPTSITSASTDSEPPPRFTATVRTVSEAELGASWRPDCPVALDDLRAVELTHWDDAGDVAAGTLVIHAAHADDVVAVFARLFDAHFPIHTMDPIAVHGADDDVSMAANNTSAFNCREISGRPGVWSQHAHGGAIDINPLVNPWVRGAQVDPPTGAPYVDRNKGAPGMIVAGDIVTRAFADIGWGWGGDWDSTLDYQHFSHDGR